MQKNPKQIAANASVSDYLLFSFLFSLKSMRILIFNKASNNHVHRLLSHLEYGGTNA